MIHSPSTFLVDTAVEELFTKEILLYDSFNSQRRAGAIAPPSYLLVDTQNSPKCNGLFTPPIGREGLERCTTFRLILWRLWLPIYPTDDHAVCTMIDAALVPSQDDRRYS